MLNNFNTKQKLTIIILIPFIGLLFFASSSIFSKYNSLESLKKFNATLTMSSKITKVIHELQIERGYSIIYLSSNGTKFRDKLIKQRLKTDKQIKALKNHINDNNYLKKEHKKTYNFDELGEYRQDINKIYVDATDVVFYYSDFIQTLIHNISKLPLLIKDKTINDRVYSLFYMVKYIEFNAIERGVASEIFVSQKLDSDSFLELNSYKYNAKAELNNFIKISNQPTLDYYKKIMKSDDKIMHYNHIIAYIYNSIYKNEILSNMKHLVGYGGLIHDFKNYLLKDQEKYKILFFQKYKKLEKQLKIYRSYHTTEVEDYYLKLIHDTFKEYKNNFKLIDDNREKSIPEIDKIVKINDNDALIAFDSLYSGLLGIDVEEWFDTTTYRIDKLVNVQNYIINKLFKSSQKLSNKLNQELQFFILILSVMVVLVVLLSAIVLKDISNKLIDLQDGIKSFLSYISKDEKEFNYLDVEGNDEFAQMAKNLNQSIMQTNRHIYQEIKKASETEKQIQENAKMVQMGEMIGNIAHQWRQPLSAIGSTASGMKLENSLGLLSTEDIDTYCDNISLKAQYLSKTIDTFRDFIKEKKEMKKVVVHDIIEDVVRIISATLDDNYIKLIKKYDTENPIEATIVASELSQVIINLINNAKDILVEKQLKEPKIFINCELEEDEVIISVEDNAGGVPEDIITKIFNPYFTTKHKSQGTGLGLHMSKRIAKETLGGDLSVANSDIGAKFSIRFQKTKVEN